MPRGDKEKEIEKEKEKDICPVYRTIFDQLNSNKIIQQQMEEVRTNIPAKREFNLGIFKNKINFDRLSSSGGSKVKTAPKGKTFSAVFLKKKDFGTAKSPILRNSFRAL